MFNILDRYIGRTVLSTILLTLFLLVGLAGIIKFIEQLRRVSNDYDTLAVGLYVLLSIPKDIELFFPMAALLGALFGLGLFAMRSELVVMEVAGFTRFHIILSVMKVAIPLVILSMFISEWVAPVAEQKAREMRSLKLYGASLTVTQNGLWAKDGSEVVYINRVNGDQSINGIAIYQFTPENQLRQIITADHGKYGEGAWQLSAIEQSDLSDDTHIVAQQRESMRWQSQITPDKLAIVAMHFESLSVRQLYSYIQFLDASKQDAKQYKLRFWGKIFQPVSVAVMMLMALAFIFGPLRGSSLGGKVLLGICVGFAFYLLDRVFGSFSIVYGLSPVLCALVPSMVFLVMSLFFIKRSR